MPTYAYRCEACGHAADEWLKMSEATAERTCPSCGAASYRKQVSAPAFQLKGSGWYVTDFRGGANSSSSPAPAEKKSEDTPAPACGACGSPEPCPAAPTTGS
ncbi:FmdB family zinc ribbon protein [Derxia gummosa]|uniref:FmdB family zinc ribbon protein n=1 Tax=Derxia gummosa DSM 723 TaxID=1121388 RepID=A0A8B6X848_9BURK|nr:FmdB family zinc ribbon protein [Derxia gummosa]